MTVYYVLSIYLTFIIVSSNNVTLSENCKNYPVCSKRQYVNRNTQGVRANGRSSWKKERVPIKMLGC